MPQCDSRSCVAVRGGAGVRVHVFPSTSEGSAGGDGCTGNLCRSQLEPPRSTALRNSPSAKMGYL